MCLRNALACSYGGENWGRFCAAARLEAHIQFQRLAAEAKERGGHADVREEAVQSAKRKKARAKIRLASLVHRTEQGWKDGDGRIRASSALFKKHLWKYRVSLIGYSVLSIRFAQRLQRRRDVQANRALFVHGPLYSTSFQ